MPINTFRETGFRVPKLTRLDVRKSAQALLDYMTIHYGWQKPYVPIESPRKTRRPFSLSQAALADSANWR